MRTRPLRAVSSLVLAVTVVAMLVLSFGVMTRRWQAVPVLSGSMAPAIEAGSLAFSVSADRSEVRPGDVLVFRAPTGARPVTVHRVESVTQDPGRALLTTKGDANSVSDPWGEFAVSSPRVWRVTGSLAGLGRIVLWARTPAAQLLGFIALVVCGAIFLSDWRLSRRRRVATLTDAPVPTDVGEPVAGEGGTDELPAPAPAETVLVGPDPDTTPVLDPGHHVAPRRTPTALRPVGAETVDSLGDAPDSPLVEVTRRLDAIDPAWRWEPFATDADGAPWFERDEHGRPTAFWLRLHVDRTVRTGTATRRAGSRDVRQDLVVEALRFAAEGIEDRPLRLPEARPSSSRPRIGRAGAVVTSLILPVLLVGVGPGASASFADRAQGSLTVNTRQMSSPELVSAETAAVLGACEVTLTWIASGTAGVDGYVFDRQPIAIGTAESDALGLTSPDPTGPWETVLRVAGGSTTTAVDTLPEEELQTASRFRYRARATIGSWESADSNVVEAQALGTCLDDKKLAKELRKDTGLSFPVEPAPTDTTAGEPTATDVLEPVIAPAAASTDGL